MDQDAIYTCKGEFRTVATTSEVEIYVMSSLLSLEVDQRGRSVVCRFLIRHWINIYDYMHPALTPVGPFPNDYELDQNYYPRVNGS